MASDLYSNVRVLNGVDLANYFPEQRSYNSVLYVHKKFLPNPIEKDSKLDDLKSKTRKEPKKVKEKVKKKKKGLVTHDKSQQFSYCDYEGDTWKDNKTYKVRVSDPVLEQTIKFAKNIVPFVIPPSRDVSPPPVFYTIKATQKSRKKPHKHREHSDHLHEVTYKKEKSKKLVETFRNDKVLNQRESFSIKETVSYGSQNNTLDELHINPSLCCSLSEISEKHLKREKSSKKCKQNDLVKLGPSESFEALATELISQTGDAKIKIHLMNETDKNIFSDSIRIPILHAIKECFLELNHHNNMNTELVTVQRNIKCNSNKLDNILDKLTCIEKKLDERVNEKEKMKTNISEAQATKAGTLEILGQGRQDLIEIKEDSSEEECYEEDLYERKNVRGKNSVLQLNSGQSTDEIEIVDKRVLGCGEETSRVLDASGQLGAKPDRPNRIPARFCWTDATRKK